MTDVPNLGEGVPPCYTCGHLRRQHVAFPDAGVVRCAAPDGLSSSGTCDCPGYTSTGFYDDATSPVEVETTPTVPDTVPPVLVYEQGVRDGRRGRDDLTREAVAGGLVVGLAWTVGTIVGDLVRAMLEERNTRDL